MKKVLALLAVVTFSKLWASPYERLPQFQMPPSNRYRITNLQILKSPGPLDSPRYLMASMEHGDTLLLQQSGMSFRVLQACEVDHETPVVGGVGGSYSPENCTCHAECAFCVTGAPSSFYQLHRLVGGQLKSQVLKQPPLTRPNRKSWHYMDQMLGAEWLLNDTRLLTISSSGRTTTRSVTADGKIALVGEDKFGQLLPPPGIASLDRSIVGYALDQRSQQLSIIIAVGVADERWKMSLVTYPLQPLLQNKSSVPIASMTMGHIKKKSDIWVTSFALVNNGKLGLISVTAEMEAASSSLLLQVEMPTDLEAPALEDRGTTALARRSSSRIGALVPVASPVVEPETGTSLLVLPDDFQRTLISAGSGTEVLAFVPLPNDPMRSIILATHGYAFIDQQGELSQATRFERNESITHWTLSPRRDLLVFSTSGKAVFAWDLKTLTMQYLGQHHGSDIRSITISPSLDFIAVGAHMGVLTAWQK